MQSYLWMGESTMLNMAAEFLMTAQYVQCIGWSSMKNKLFLNAFWATFMWQPMSDVVSDLKYVSNIPRGIANMAAKWTDFILWKGLCFLQCIIGLPSSQRMHSILYLNVAKVRHLQKVASFFEWLSRVHVSDTLRSNKCSCLCSASLATNKMIVLCSVCRSTRWRSGRGRRGVHIRRKWTHC